MYLRFSLILLTLLLFCNSVYSQPEISSVDGDVVSNGSITLFGTGFGEKDQAAPILYDFTSFAYVNGEKNFSQSIFENGDSAEDYYGNPDSNSLWNEGGSVYYRYDLIPRVLDVDAHYFGTSQNSWLGNPKMYKMDSPEESDQLYVSWWFKPKIDPKGWHGFTLLGTNVSDFIINETIYLKSNPNVEGRIFAIEESTNRIFVEAKNSMDLDPLIENPVVSSESSIEFTIRNHIYDISNVSGDFQVGDEFMLNSTGDVGEITYIDTQKNKMAGTFDRWVSHGDYYTPIRNLRTNASLKIIRYYDSYDTQGSSKYIRIWEDGSGKEGFRFSWTQMHMTCSDGPTTWGGADVVPRNWNLMEAVIDLNQNYSMYTNGKFVGGTSTQNCRKVDGNYNPTIALMGFNGKQEKQGWEMGEIYMDNTLQRILISNSSTWDPSTISYYEIQMPKTWSDTEVSFNLRQGQFDDSDDLYAYVFDEIGEVNQEGFKITDASQDTSDELIPEITSIQGSIKEGETITLNGNYFSSRTQDNPVLFDRVHDAFEYGELNTVASSLSEGDYILTAIKTDTPNAVWATATSSPTVTISQSAVALRHAFSEASYNLKGENAWVGRPVVYGGEGGWDDLPVDENQLYISWWYKNEYESRYYWRISDLDRVGTFIENEELLVDDTYSGEYIGIDEDNLHNMVIQDNHNSNNLKNVTIVGLESGAQMRFPPNFRAGNGDGYETPGTKQLRIWDNPDSLGIRSSYSLTDFFVSVPTNRSLGSNRVYDSAHLKKNEWTHFEIEMDTEKGIYQSRINGRLRGVAEFDPRAIYEGEFSPTVALLGNNAGQEKLQNSHLSDIYVDDSFQRVVLSDSSTWNDSQENYYEVQREVNWDDNSIQFVVNQGNFNSGDTAYVYVFTRDGITNKQGYEIEIDGGSEDTTDDLSQDFSCADIYSNDPNIFFCDGFETADLRSTNDGNFDWKNMVRTSIVTMDEEGPVAVYNNGDIFNRPSSNKNWLALSGNYSIRFRYPAGEPMAEQRFDFGGNSYEQLWLSYWIRVPENFKHGPRNNKLLALWMDGYSTNGDGGGVVIGFWPFGENGSSNFEVSVNSGRNTVFGGFQQSTGFIRVPEDRGKWMHLIVRAKAESSEDASDGEVEVWRKWESENEYNQTHNLQNEPIRIPDEGPQGFAAGYFMGWANDGYEEETEWLMDNVVFSNSSLLYLFNQTYLNGDGSSQTNTTIPTNSTTDEDTSSDDDDSSQDDDSNDNSGGGSSGGSSGGGGSPGSGSQDDVESDENESSRSDVAYEAPVCQSDFSYSAWSSCVNGTQFRIVTDENTCVDSTQETRICRIGADENEIKELNAKEVQLAKINNRRYETSFSDSYNEMVFTNEKLEDESFVVVDSATKQQYLGTLVDQKQGKYYYTLDRIDQNNLNTLKEQGLAERSFTESASSVFENFKNSRNFFSVLVILSLFGITTVIYVISRYIKKLHRKSSFE